jgi:hypothetical protein
LRVDSDDAKKLYTEKYNVTPTEAQEVYEDVVSQKYQFVNIDVRGRDTKLWVGTNGRDLLRRVWLFNTGKWKAYANESKDFLHLTLAFISGVVIGTAGLIITIIVGYSRTK